MFAFACVALLATSSVDGVFREQGLRAAEARGEFPRLTSVLVDQNGKTVAEAYFNESDPDTLHDTRSATKSVTALALVMTLTALVWLTKRFFRAVHP